MTLDTQRLELVALTARQLELWCKHIHELESELDCRYEGQAMSGQFLDLVEKQIEVCENDAEHYLWHSFWLVTRKSDQVVVGSCGFKDKPNEACEVELGYGLNKTHEHSGYMTECIKALSSWALKQQGVSHVIAETESDNVQSQKVLERCGFKQYDNKDINLWWRL